MNKRGDDFKRPKLLDGVVYKFQNQGVKWCAIVGLLNGVPYEIFTGEYGGEEGFFIPDGVQNVKIEKTKDEQGNNTFNLHYHNKKGFKAVIEGLQQLFNPVYWNYAKFISGMLRYEMKVSQVVRIVEGLYEEQDTINSWKAGVLRVLRKYEDTEPISVISTVSCNNVPSSINCNLNSSFTPLVDKRTRNLCPECQMNTVVNQGGCNVCESCGYSKCG